MKYTPTIGIECHVQLNTKTKLFAAVANDARGAKPNSLISHICLGMPGALPVLNAQAIKLACRSAFALNTKPQKFSKFDRKHYFYPDLPKGYQITQYDEPIIKGGHVELEVNGQTHRVGITRVHLEEDAGKNLHPVGKDYSLVDLNRAGTPLLEIVSEPDMHSAEAAKAYARELYLLMQYAEVSDCDLHEGHMRFDVNISVSSDPKNPGTRTEVKNLNSFKSVASAVEYEIHRQTELIEAGHKILQETRGWDEAKQKTSSQRGKEEAHDYRYFPEPDIPPIELSEVDIKTAQANLPTLPTQLRKKLASYQMASSTIETLVGELRLGLFMESILSYSSETINNIGNWLAGEGQSLVTASKLSWANAKLDKSALQKLSKMVESKKLSSTAAKQILGELLTHGGDPEQIANKLKLLQISDESDLSTIIKSVVTKHPKAVSDFKSGENKAIGFLVGQVMAASLGRANPKVAREMLIKQIKS